VTRAWKIAAALLAVAAAVLLFPYVRDFVDLLGADEDGTDSTVSSIVEWLLAVALAMLIYTALAAAPRLFTRLRSRS
jgi:hypothetical protein